MEIDLSKYKVGMFAERESVNEAREYMEKVIESMPEDIRVYAYTAVYVFSNSIVKAIEEELNVAR